MLTGYAFQWVRNGTPAVDLVCLPCFAFGKASSGKSLLDIYGKDPRTDILSSDPADDLGCSSCGRPMSQASGRVTCL